MSKLLFNEFSEVSAKQWKQKIQADLKGADYNETLISHTLEGIDIKPFYHNDDLKTVETVTGSNSWKVTHKIFVKKASEANEKALETIENGVEAIWFVIPSAETDVNILLRNIDTEKTDLFISPEFLSVDFMNQLNEFCKNGKNTIFYDQDIINHLAKTGNWFENLEKDHDTFLQILKISNNNIGSLSVDATLYQNAGANSVQQLAYALAHANEYLNFLNNKEMLPAQKAPFQFKVAIGNDYFMEIAKLRALRILFKSLAKEYGIDESCFILAEPSKRNKTIYDYNVNMLRTTTECMSAILGGADAISNMPYDALYKKPNSFGDRISKNQLLILKHESYFDIVNNPVDGTYYIEELTRQLAEKALALFKQIEDGGGFVNQLKEHTIQRKIKENASAEQELFDAGKRVLVGTNKYKNEQDRMKDNLEISPFQVKNIRKTIVEPILERRLAENLEKQCLETENS